MEFTYSGDEVVDVKLSGERAEKWKMGLAVAMRMGMRREDVRRLQEDIIDADEMIESFEFIASDQYSRL